MNRARTDRYDFETPLEDRDDPALDSRVFFDCGLAFAASATGGPRFDGQDRKDAHAHVAWEQVSGRRCPLHTYG